jgi:hypothetical protein
MRDELVWMLVAVVGLVFGVCHFIFDPVHLTGRTWDAVIGAAILGNAAMFVVNAAELWDERRAGRSAARVRR